VRGQVNAQLLDVVGTRREDWQEFADVGVMNEREDFLSRDLLPSRSVTWNGQSFSTNQWGMRDQEYELTKPAGTLRIALMGPSHVMGNGVSDGETFEALVEARLNREFADGPAERYEILNFGVDGYAMPQQVALLAEKALAFSPDVVIVTHYHQNRLMTERFLTKVLWPGYEIRDVRLRELLVRTGVEPLPRGRTPVPTETGRRLARAVGIEPRMPSGEFNARIRRISDEVENLSFTQLGEIARERGIVVIVLALDDVLDNAPHGIPAEAAIRAAGLPVIDLFEVFPPGQRASLRVAPWDNHPNRTGHQLIADRLYPELTALLWSNKSGGSPTRTENATEGVH